MPKITNVSVTYDRKINLGDYNSVKFGLTVWADVDEDEDLDAAMKALWEMAKENVRQQAARVKDRQVVQVEEIFLGLPVDIQKEIMTNGN